jgi:hypothetical protein
VNPSSGQTIISSNLEVTGDLSIDGKIDLGNQVAVDLGGATANTALQVGGGFISGSNEVACKRYSKTFTRGTNDSHDIHLEFGPYTFYAKIVAMLRRTDTSSVRDMSTIVLEVQGGTHDGSTSGLDEPIALGTKNVFGSDNDYPWSSVVVMGARGIILKPHTGKSDANRSYSYDIFVELVTSRGGTLESIRTNTASFGGDDADDFSNPLLQTFNY